MIAILKRIVTSPRLYVYCSCTAAAVIASYLIGKDMLWDTMDYHVYAGFSALHDRFNLDYFAAGPQAYFNPYGYVPFYLLIRSSLTPLEDASILAALQSAILWLSYELAVAVAPADERRTRTITAMVAAAFAFANPVLIFQLGSSYIDITTAELALAGWTLILGTVRDGGVSKLIWGAVLLGGASALKLTNAVHAVAAIALVAFVPGPWKSKFRHAVAYVVGVAIGFVAISAPWSIHLERRFGNPLFPLLNGVFRSPEYSTGPMVAYRFIPQSLGDALLRPFAMVLQSRMVDVEWTAPDLRYAVLAILALVVVVRWAVRRVRLSQSLPATATDSGATSRLLLALGCGFAVDWVLWLTASGNGRYFIPMACVAAVLDVALIFRLFAGRLRLRNYLLLALAGMEVLQLCMGTEYRPGLAWHDGPWVNLSIPSRLRSETNLYFLMGEQTNSFIIPYLAKGSGFVSLDSEYGLGPDGKNGARIRRLIERFNPRLMVIFPASDSDGDHQIRLPETSTAANALLMFGLKVDEHHCGEIVARGVAAFRFTAGGPGKVAHRDDASAPNTEYLASCRLTWNKSEMMPPVRGRHAADLAFDHLERSCPALFQPAHPIDRLSGDSAEGYAFSRRYANTEILAWISHGRIRFQQFVGGLERSAGSEREWEPGPLPVVCGRAGGGFLRLLTPVVESP